LRNSQQQQQQQQRHNASLDRDHAGNPTRSLRRQSVAMFDPDKKKNSRWRWNNVWTFLVLGIGCAPCWINYAFGCETGWAIMAVIIVLLDVAYWIGAVMSWPTLYREWREYRRTSPELRRIPETQLDSHRHLITSSTTSSSSAAHGIASLVNDNDGDAKGSSNGTGNGNGNAMDADDNEIRHSMESGTLPPLCHLVIMTGYDEPVELICATLDTVAAQTKAKHIIMVIALEERTPDVMDKANFFDNRYGSCFFRLIQTVHPFGLPGEIAGTCSNANWGVRQATTLMRDEGIPFDPETTLLTKLDTDTLFLPTHFEVLEREFLSLPKEERIAVQFQSVLCYNLGLDKRWFFTRVTGILRTFFTIGFLIPLSINTMSIYSMSLSLARKADYWLPHYQMEDIIQNLNLMVGCQRRVRIRLLPIPTISGPTSGKNIWDEFVQWFLQVRRWSIGAAEVFHYYCVKLFGGKFDLISGLSYGLVFTGYYVFVLTLTGMFHLTSTWGTIINGCGDVTGYEPPWRSTGEPIPFPYLSPHVLLMVLLIIKFSTAFATAFVADIMHKRILGVKEPTIGLAGGPVGVIRSIFHFFSSPIVLMVYTLTKAAAFIELSIRGREICGHVVSRKESIATSVSTSNVRSTLTPADWSSVKGLSSNVSESGSSSSTVSFSRNRRGGSVIISSDTYLKAHAFSEEGEDEDKDEKAGDDSGKVEENGTAPIKP